MVVGRKKASAARKKKKKEGGKQKGLLEKLRCEARRLPLDVLPFSCPCHRASTVSTSSRKREGAIGARSERSKRGRRGTWFGDDDPAPLLIGGKTIPFDGGNRALPLPFEPSSPCRLLKKHVVKPSAESGGRQAVTRRGKRGKLFSLSPIARAKPTLRSRLLCRSTRSLSHSLFVPLFFLPPLSQYVTAQNASRKRRPND